MKVKLRVYDYSNRVVLTDHRGRLHAARGEYSGVGGYLDYTYNPTLTSARLAAEAVRNDESVATIINILESES